MRLLSRPYCGDFWFASSGLGAVRWECWFLISVSSCTEVSPPWLWPHVPLSPVISGLRFSFYRASTCDSPTQDHLRVCFFVRLRERLSKSSEEVALAPWRHVFFCVRVSKNKTFSHALWDCPKRYPIRFQRCCLPVWSCPSVMLIRPYKSNRKSVICLDHRNHSSKP